MTKFPTQRLSTVDPSEVGQGVFACISQLQHLPTTEQQLASSAVLLLMYCHQLNARVGDVLEVANNIIDRTIQETEQLKAAKDFVRHEL